MTRSVAGGGGTWAHGVAGTSPASIASMLARHVAERGAAWSPGANGAITRWTASGQPSLWGQVMVHDPSQLGQGVLEPPVHHVPGQTQNSGNLCDREHLWHIDTEA